MSFHAILLYHAKGRGTAYYLSITGRAWPLPGVGDPILRVFLSCRQLEEEGTTVLQAPLGISHALIGGPVLLERDVDISKQRDECEGLDPPTDHSFSAEKKPRDADHLLIGRAGLGAATAIDQSVAPPW